MCGFARVRQGVRVYRLIVFADRLHARVRGIRAVGWCAWIVRVLLAVAFLPSGLTKVLGAPGQGVVRPGAAGSAGRTSAGRMSGRRFGSATPRSVTTASMRRAGVTSNAGL